MKLTLENFGKFWRIIHLQIRLIVVDSFSYLFRSIDSDLNLVQITYGILLMLQQISEEFKCAVIYSFNIPYYLLNVIDWYWYFIFSYYECIYNILGGDNKWVDNTHYTRREEIYSSITWWKSFSSGELSDFDRTWFRQSEVDCGKCRQVLRSMWEKGGLSSKLKNWTFQLNRTHV